ncbi:hypothetical protein EYF80_038508 [Liparis tanakae]|uniref:Uncharacterized protein n=1 Tax=Liparis tanakae TaxID=230148 RepID=A0A4Z2GDF3_9TELE|nr:hypothetical protein EYF80_038508 [Liparis tanakae]
MKVCAPHKEHTLKLIHDAQGGLSLALHPPVLSLSLPVNDAAGSSFNEIFSFISTKRRNADG